MGSRKLYLLSKQSNGVVKINFMVRGKILQVPEMQ